MQGLADLYAIPFFILATVLSPWRMISLFKTVYRYGEAYKIKEEISFVRRDIFSRLELGVKDWRALIEIVILIALPYRLPFLVAILKKNVYYSENLEKEPSLEKQPKANGELAQVLLKGSSRNAKRLNFHKCVHITFKEFCKDSIYVPFGILSVSLAPWRVITIYGILKSQIQRAPSSDDFKEIPSKRHELFELFVQVLTFDYPCAFMTLLLIFTMYKIPNVFRIYRSFLKLVFSNSEQVKQPHSLL